ncbi:MAG TPA: 50S ribosome-binding GTPase [Gemmatales bacterium]|nr:50S ribosome-binding GTPase [Gemmatales bacterium]
MSRDVVCCLSPAGASAIAVVGLRGPTVWSKLSPYFTSTKKQPTLSKVPQTYLGKLQRDGLGDEVILVLTGDETHQEIELQLHGGPGVVTWCLQLAVELGCERIEWPEWIDTDLWKLLPLATTKKTAGMLLDQCLGAFDRTLTALKQPASDRCQRLTEVDELLSWESLGTHLVQPWKIVLAGPPNVGKSSLLNALLGFERAITSSIPGTTRDLVAATVVWDGYPLEFIDTAGLRQQGGSLETAGMDQTRLISKQADLVIWLTDLSERDPVIPTDIQPNMIIGTKSDLPHQNKSLIELNVSAKTGSGLKELLAAVLQKLLPQPPQPGQALPVIPSQVAELHHLRQILCAS